MSYIISCCSTADLSKEYFESRNINYVCFHYQLDGVDHLDDLGQTMSFKDFYTALDNGAEPKTSQINVEEYENYFTKFLDEGHDIVHLCLSSGISGSYNSANIAKDLLTEKFPDRKIYIIDSLAASSGFGLLMDKIADLRDEGMPIEQLVDWIENNKLDLNHWFFSSDLKFFIKGGRVSKASGFIGGMLNICPLLNVDNSGHLIPRMKIRTKKKAIRACADKMTELAKNGTDYDGKCFISHSACYEDARALADIIEESFPKLNGKVSIFDIGTTIGSHTGPGTVALFFWGQKRVD